jgi:hypothetical protein
MSLKELFGFFFWYCVLSEIYEVHPSNHQSLSSGSLLRNNLIKDPVLFVEIVMENGRKPKKPWQLVLWPGLLKKRSLFSTMFHRKQTWNVKKTMSETDIFFFENQICLV